MGISSESNIAENKVDQQFSMILYVLNCLMDRYSIIFYLSHNCLLPLDYNDTSSQSIGFYFCEYMKACLLVRALMRINKLRVREGQANRRCADCITTNTQKEKERERESSIQHIRNNNSTAVLLLILIEVVLYGKRSFSEIGFDNDRSLSHMQVCMYSNKYYDL